MARVKHPPAPFHTITPHLCVRGAAKAIEFYKRAFGAKELERAAAPDGVSLMHAVVQIGDSVLMLHDEFPETGGQSPQSLEGTAVTLHVYVDDADEVFKRAIAAGAKADMEMQDAFWGDRYGQFTDPFGHSWSVATKLEHLSRKQKDKRAGELLE